MKQPHNVAASVKQRLLNIARERREDFNLLLTRYGIERLLYRFTQSEHSSDFVLKGAMLFHLWIDVPHRSTRDLDLLARGSPDRARLEEVFRSVCKTPVEDDGLTFRADTIRAERIREETEYDGIRIRLEGLLGSARIHLQVDVGFGNAIIPPPERVEFPVLLDQPVPRLRAYRRETMVSEKLQAMVDLGIANSRLKDFFDLRFLATAFEFRGLELARAIEATFSRRQTPFPGSVPTALTDAFAKDGTKRTQWRAFLRRSRLDAENLELEAVVAALREFLLPPVEALAAGTRFDLVWNPGGPWHKPARPEA
jgi:hypothetical protein